MRHLSRRRMCVIAAVVLVSVFVWLYVRRNPASYRHTRREFEIPRPFLTRDDLREILRPRPGENILEVGPGKGYYSLDVAREISPEGTLHILDVQREMLDLTLEKAGRAGIRNIEPTLSDAADLPFLDGSMDAAFLVAVLGEVPDRSGAVSELRRVIRPGGRVVIGEAATDPHRVSSDELRGMCEDAGLLFVRESGGLLGRFYLFTVPA